MKLPKFIFNKVKTHSTSLGNNAAFPPEEDYPFDYKILKKRMIEVHEELQSFDDLRQLDNEQLISKLSELLTECKQQEEPIRDNLVKVCENLVAEIFSIPVETVDIVCSIVSAIKPQNAFRLLPEDSDARNFDFEDLNDFDNVLKVVLKRRFINAMIQGAAYRLSDINIYSKAIQELNPNLLPLYERIRVINDYLLFTQEEKITDKHPMQGACVEVELGREGEKTHIAAQGLTFPYLFTETLRGLFELFASHGLPKDNEKAQYIIKQSDFLLAEPWDLRMGVKLWDYINNNLENTKIIPYYFMSLCEMKVDEFNENMREILAHTKKGQSIQQSLIAEAEHNFEYDDLSASIQTKNANVSVIEDEYMSEMDLNEFVIDEDEEQSETLNYGELLGNCNYTDIDFYLKPYGVDGIPTSKPIFQAIPIIFGEMDDIEIPVELVNLKAEKINLPQGVTYQLHITIDESLRRMGIATKLYRAFINIKGSACSLYHNRKETYYQKNNMEDTTNGAISKLWNTLGSYPEIHIMPITRNQQEIGVVAFQR